MTLFFIRTAGEKDLAEVSALLAETWHATYDAIYGAARVEEITRSWHRVSELRPRLTRPNSEFLVGDDGTRLGGMAFAAAGVDGKTVVLHQLYVRPDLQGQGLGRDLLTEIEQSFPEAKRLRLEVEERNLAAIAFYGKAGFARIGSTAGEGAVDPETPVAVYEKALH